MLDDVDTTKKFPAPRPVVTLSYAQTLDERLATSTGSSQWINARESLRFSHELRAKAALHQRGIGSVQVEGGAGVITVLLQARLLDRLDVCIAPKMMRIGRRVNRLMTANMTTAPTAPAALAPAT